MKRRLAAVAAAVVAAAGLAGCRDGGPRGDWVLDVQGRAVASSPGGERTTWNGGRHEVDRDATILVERGRAVLDLPGDAELELRAALTGNGRGSKLRVATVPEVLDGDALVLARRATVRLRAGAATFRVTSGIARVHRGTGAGLALYTGRAEVDARGRNAEVPALRQLTVSDSGALAQRPAPISYRDDRPDPWDQRFLGDAIDLGRQLDRRAKALAVIAAPVTGEGVVGVVPELGTAAGWDPSLVDGRWSLGETLVGAAIALHGGAGSFVDRWNATFAFRAEGARWGVVAADREASRGAVLAQLDGLLDQTPLRLVSNPGGRKATAPSASASSSTNVGGGTGSATTPTTAPGRPLPTVPSAPPTTVPPTVLPGITVPGITTTTTVPRSTTTTTTRTTTTLVPGITVGPVTVPPTPAPTVAPTPSPNPSPSPISNLLDNLLGARGVPGRVPALVEDLLDRLDRRG